MAVHRCLGRQVATSAGLSRPACMNFRGSNIYHVPVGCTLVVQPDREWPTARFEAATGAQRWQASVPTGFAGLTGSAASLRRPPRQCGDTERGPI
jgi:hypothetical protein